MHLTSEDNYHAALNSAMFISIYYYVKNNFFSLFFILPEAYNNNMNI